MALPEGRWTWAFRRDELFTSPPQRGGWLCPKGGGAGRSVGMSYSPPRRSGEDGSARRAQPGGGRGVGTTRSGSTNLACPSGQRPLVRPVATSPQGVEARPPPHSAGEA